MTFAHVADLHLPPGPPEKWPHQYRQAIGWWDAFFDHPHQILPRLLDEISARGVDFVFFGGDTLDCYHEETAGLVVRLCRERGLPAYFQVGNHDCENPHTRYVVHECDRERRASTAERLMKRDWQMPGLAWAIERQGVRFIALDTPYFRVDGGWAGVFGREDVDWLIGQLDHDGPIIVFHHVPFNLPTVEHRLHAVWNGVRATLAEDENGRRVRAAIENCPNILGTFAAHAHFRSEDPLGGTWQFMTGPAHSGRWRHVRIGDAAPREHRQVPEEAVVDPSKG